MEAPRTSPLPRCLFFLRKTEHFGGVDNGALVLAWEHFIEKRALA